MSESAEPTRYMSAEEYLALERASPTRHEYVDGVVDAMTAASRRHNRIAGNVYRLLAAAAGDGPCRVYVDEVRVRVTPRTFYYPDVVVACEPPGDDAYEENAPCLVVAVLSPSTETTDVRERALLYRGNSMLQANLMVHQENRRVERHYRDATGEWRYEEVPDDRGSVAVPCPAAAITFNESYAGVDREEPARPRRVREAAG